MGPDALQDLVESKGKLPPKWNELQIEEQRAATAMFLSSGMTQESLDALGPGFLDRLRNTFKGASDVA